jgi:hypothetical protein
MYVWRPFVKKSAQFGIKIPINVAKTIPTVLKMFLNDPPLPQLAW